MFKKTERLSRSEFTHYFKTGKRTHSTYFTFITTPSSTRKVAVVVGKKVAKRAVKRNTIKRRVSAALRTQLLDYSGVLIVLVKPTYTRLTRRAAREALTKAIAQATKSA